MSTGNHTIVAAVDMSKLSTLALDEAIRMVTAHPGAELHVVQVVNPPPRGSALAEAEQALKVHVGDRVTSAEKNGAAIKNPVIAHVTSGNVANQVIQLATDLHADLIALGTHGRTGVERLLVGSVAELVVRNAPCPVIVLREKDFSGGVPEIEPPCPACVASRKESHGQNLWCETHSEQRARRHTYFSIRSDSARHSPYSGGIA